MSRRLAVAIALLLLAVGAVAQTAGTIRAITITGNEKVSTAAIQAAMGTQVGQTYVQSSLDADKERIEALGFFENVDVSPKVLPDSGIEVVVLVKEFPEVKEIRITGTSAVPVEEVQKAVTIQVGQPFNRNEIQPTANAIRDLYAKRGFFAQLGEVGPLRESPNTVGITVVELTVNQVAVQGNVRTRDSVMRRLIRTRAGEPFNQVKWGRDMQRLMNTQWFESVSTTDEIVDLGRLNLTANVKETRTGMFNIGAQLDPRSSLAAIVKVSDMNFRGTGQSVGLDLIQSTGGGGTSIDLSYGNQFIDSRDTSLKVNLYSRVVYRFAGSGFGQSNSPSGDSRYSERRTGGTLGFVRPLNDTVFFSYGLRFENVLTEDDSRRASIIQQDGDIGSLQLGLTVNRRDVDIDPANGDFLRFDVEPGFSRITKVGGATASESLKGRHEFVKLSADYRVYFGAKRREFNRLDEPVRTLALRLRGGAIYGTVPFYEQFFVGGSETVRGYDEDRFWGRFMATATAEYRIPIQRAFTTSLFVDYGSAWGGYDSIRDFTQTRTPKFQLGYGIGVSFRTPLGPIRLDFGFNNRGRSRTHFLIGTSF